MINPIQQEIVYTMPCEYELIGERVIKQENGPVRIYMLIKCKERAAVYLVEDDAVIFPLKAIVESCEEISLKQAKSLFYLNTNHYGLKH